MSCPLCSDAMDGLSERLRRAMNDHAEAHGYRLGWGAVEDRMEECVRDEIGRLQAETVLKRLGKRTLP